MMPRVSDPEETAPFTHQPYGKDADDHPFVSPSGPGQVLPAPPAPPAQPASPAPYGQVPYGPTTPGQPVFPPGWVPAYAPYPVSLQHQGATTSLVLGIISVASVVLGLTCCLLTVPGVLCAPFAWGIGAKATREIARQPGVYGNLSSAQTGMWMGIVMTFVGAVVISGGVALVLWFGLNDPTLG